MRSPEHTNGIVGVDLFAGGGGLSLGASLAGVDVRLAVEVEPRAADTYAANHPDTKLMRCDIRRLRRLDVTGNGCPRVLFGGPPCQGFSTSNLRTRSRQNPANWLFREFVRLSRSWRPDWIILENVRGLCETEDGLFLERILGSLQALDYVTSWWVLNAADYGVPQRRWRLFVVGSRQGVQVPPPPATVSPQKYVTVRQAIHDLPALTNGASGSCLPYRCQPKSDYAKRMRGGMTKSQNHLVTRSAPAIVERYKHVPQGGNWEDIPAKLMRNYADRNRCHTGIYYRLREHGPSVVIGNFRKNMLIHPTQDRQLSVREAARLQSFPDWYQFQGSIGFQQQQVGNAVPPLLAKAVFATVLAACSRR